MGCDFYIITLLEGEGRTDTGKRVDVEIQYRRQRGYFLDGGNTDSDDDDARNRGKQIERYDTTRDLCESGTWTTGTPVDKYYSVVKQKYPEVDAVWNLKRITYTQDA